MSLEAHEALRSTATRMLVLRKFFIAFLIIVAASGSVQAGAAQLQKKKTRGELIGELRAIEAKLNRNPRDPQLFCQRGWRYQKLGMFGEARDDYEKALLLKPNYPPALYYKGRWYDQQMMDDQAIVFYGKALKADPKYLDAYNDRARLYSKDGRVTLALADYTMALSIYPNDEHMLFKRCELYLKLKRYREALTDIEKSLKTRPRHSEGWLDRGYCYAALGDFGKAIESFNKVEELERGSEVLSFERARVYHAMGKFKEAIKDLDRVLDVSPYVYDAYLSRAMAYVCLGEKKLAVKDLDFWIEKTDYKDDNVWLGISLAYLLKIQSGQTKEARAMVETALKSGDGPPWQKPFVQYFNDVISLDQLKKLIAAYPNDRLTIARTLLGMDRQAKKAPAEAKMEFKWVLERGSKIQLMYQVAATQMRQLQ